MAHYEGSYLILDEGESAAFQERVKYPDPDAIRRRDRLFAELDQMGITRNADGSMEIEFTPKRRPHTRSGQTWNMNSPAEVLEAELRMPHSQPLQMNWTFGPGELSAA